MRRTFYDRLVSRSDGVGPDDSTSRTTLHRPTPDDVPAMFEICSDPRVWTHYPSLRHTAPERTALSLRRWISGWETHGLGTWVVRSREDATVLGYCGCSMLGAGMEHGAVWNLGYRFAVAAQGRGLATEVSRRAIERARAAAGERPIIAYLVEHNTASAAVATKLGLTLVDRAPDTGNPDPGAVRLVYADRQLSVDELRTARGQEA